MVIANIHRAIADDPKMACDDGWWMSSVMGRSRSIGIEIGRVLEARYNARAKLWPWW